MLIPAGVFKAKCLKLMDEVHNTHEEIIVTKFGKPIAKLVPIEEADPSDFFGYLKGSVLVKSDIVAPIGEKWNADA